MCSRLISQTDGPDGLFKFDVLAHESLVATPYFRSRVIPDKARALASRFFNGLLPLLSADCRFAAGDYGLSEVFEQAFARSLALKARLLLSGGKYKLVYCFPGDVFDPQTMMRDGDTKDQFIPRGELGKGGPLAGQPEAGPGAAVRLCLFPALYLESDGRSAQAKGAGARAERCVIDYHNVVAAELKEDASVGSVLVVKAVVLV